MMSSALKEALVVAFILSVWSPILCVTGWLSVPATTTTTTSPRASATGRSRRSQQHTSLLFFHSQQNFFMRPRKTNNSLKASKDDTSPAQDVDLDYLKEQLTEYLAKRKELGADDLAKNEVGKIVGGTKGNKVLEYVSGSPNKPQVVEDAPNPLDYSELNKYGYGNLVKPIMDAGGRVAMYRLLGMDPPPSASLAKQKKRYDAPKLVIDKTGETDQARYSGLKLGQVIDDSMQAAALEDVQRKVKEGKEVRPKLQEEDYVPPFADKRNTGPRQTADWTPERLDDWGRKQGRVEAWARRSKAGAFVSDPMETTDLDLAQRVYSIVTALMVATAFGKSTSTFLTQTTSLLPDVKTADAIQGALQAPAAGLLAAAVGSMVYCVLQSQEKNRSPSVWALKGFLGGPFSVRLLRELQPLLTQEETDALDA